jgi:pyruvate dehydrogenase kinase 2/3/4
MSDNAQLCRSVQEMLNEHLIAIPALARGVAQVSMFLRPQQADKFMNDTICSRIGRRVLVEQHVALTEQFQSGSHTSMIGIVDTKCNSTIVIENSVKILQRLFFEEYNTSPPNVTVTGEATFMYIPSHIEFLLFEIIRNSMRYSRETGMGRIHVTVGQDEHQIVFRVSDQSKGMPTNVMDTLWSWTQASKRNAHRFMDDTIISGIIDENKSFNTVFGLGLPMCKVYTTYWGGNLQVYNMPGLGLDTYITLSTNNEFERLESD